MKSIKIVLSLIAILASTTQAFADCTTSESYVTVVDNNHCRPWPQNALDFNLGIFPDWYATHLQTAEICNGYVRILSSIFVSCE